MPLPMREAKQAGRRRTPRLERVYPTSAVWGSLPGVAVRALQADEARAVFDAAARADNEVGPGRDFYYRVELVSGELVEGVIATPLAEGLTLADVEDDNRHRPVEWDAIRSVSITGYS